MALLTTPPSGDGPFWPFLLFCLVLMGLALLPVYVTNALPLFLIAKRRGLKGAWLAWVPIGDGYILGSISDDFQLLCRNELKNRRLWLPLLMGATVVLCIFAPVLAIAWVEDWTVQLTLTNWLLLIAAATSSVVGAVIKWMATYDLFRSCVPKNAGLYLAISVVVQIVMPTFGIIREIFMLVVCKKDLGMPTLNRPQQEPEAWSPAQPRKEPWDI